MMGKIAGKVIRRLFSLVDLSGAEKPSKDVAEGLSKHELAERMRVANSSFDEIWEVKDGEDRRRKVYGRLRELCELVHESRDRKPQILDLGGSCYHEDFLNDSDADYAMIDLDKKMDKTGGGYNAHPAGNTYNGRDLPYKENEFDIIHIGFVLHHASENTLYLLEQVNRISSSFVVILEDLSEVNYPDAWHRRNFEHQVGGVFRSDDEWRRLFVLLGYSLKEAVAIRREDDAGPQVFRAMYVLSTRSN